MKLKKVRITALRQHIHSDLIELYENTPENPCDVATGSVFISENAEMPKGMCASAWESMRVFVEELAAGGGNFYDGWMKDPRSAMISCNDGFRPMSFLIEAID